MDINRLPKSLPRISSCDYEWGLALERMRSVGHEQVACAMGIESRRFLFELVREQSFWRILDIGTYLGTSAMNFALAAGGNGLITTVDITPDHHVRLGVPPPTEAWYNAGVSKHIEQVFADSRDFLRMQPRIFDLISIDGWHEEKCVYEEIKLASYRLRPGGTIFLDDVQPPDYIPPEGNDFITGPYRALMRVLKEFPELRMERPTSATAVLLRN